MIRHLSCMTIECFSFALSLFYCGWDISLSLSLSLSLKHPSLRIIVFQHGGWWIITYLQSANPQKSHCAYEAFDTDLIICAVYWMKQSDSITAYKTDHLNVYSCKYYSFCQWIILWISHLLIEMSDQIQNGLSKRLGGPWCWKDEHR